MKLAFICMVLYNLIFDANTEHFTSHIGIALEKDAIRTKLIFIILVHY